MCRDTRVFHHRDERTRRGHAWDFNPRLIGPGVSVRLCEGIVICAFGYELKENKCCRQQNLTRGSVFGSEAQVPMVE